MGSCLLTPIVVERIAKKKRLISIEGNISSGKSTIMKSLKEELKSSNYIFLPENLNEWDKFRDSEGIPLFQSFCEDPEKYGFAFQILVLSSQLNALQQASRTDLDSAVIIVERSLQTSLNVFGRLLESTGKMGS